MRGSGSAGPLHIEARNADLVSVRGFDGDVARRDNGREVAPIAPERVAEERQWWRLAIYEDRDRLLAWFQLSRANEPVLFGTELSSPGTVFGPLGTHVSGARYPRWGGAPDGSWRYEVYDAEFVTPPPVMPPLPGQ